MYDQYVHAIKFIYKEYHKMHCQCGDVIVIKIAE